jgi:SAM-dependent methyltransferase
MTRHEEETERNLRVWREKAILREVYAQGFARIDSQIDPGIPGPIVEIGSGLGNFHEYRGEVISSDRFLQPWMDVVADGYALPYRSGSLSHLILIDVFHHLAAPFRFFEEARRVLGRGGRVILYEPYVSLASLIPYGVLHPEGIHWRAEVNRPQANGFEYYAAQGNATRFFFHRDGWLDGWEVIRRERYAAFAYLLSGGFSRPALYPPKLLPVLQRIDGALSRFPRLFAARCMVVLTPRS